MTINTNIKWPIWDDKCAEKIFADLAKNLKGVGKMTDIEKAIHDKKAEAKKIQREISELQEKLRESNEPRWYRLDFIDGPHSYAYRYGITVQIESNKPIDRTKLKAAIESLSDPIEIKSYIDWNKIKREAGWPLAQFVFVDKNGNICAMVNKPRNNDGWIVDVPLWDVRERWPDAIIGPLPAWDKSLIHRPGVKE